MESTTASGAEPRELARALYAALAAGDRETLATLLHPEFQGQGATGLPLGLGGRYDGPEPMRREFWGRIAQHFVARAEPERFHPLDDGQLLVTGRYVGHGRASGKPLDASFAHLVRIADGRISRLEQYTDTQRWHEALSGAAESPTRRALSVVEYDVTEGVATVRLNRPEAGNAIDVVLADDLCEAATRCAEDPSVRAVLLSATGTTFTTGGDLALFADLTGDQLAATLRRMTDSYHLALHRLSELDAPVVCAVRGAAAGGGMGLPLCSDVVVAAEDSKFVLGYGALGLTADGGTSWFLPRVVGLRRAQQMFLSQRALSAAEALEWGLVTRLVPTEDVDAEALSTARTLAEGPTRAFGAMRRLLRDSLSTSLTEQLAAEQQTMVQASTSADAAEGIAGFVRKRTPQFSGL